jgi:hypothetical protein
VNSSGIFDRWYETSGVRSDRRHVFHDELDAGRTPFPVHLMPYLHHPLTADLPDEEKRALVTRRLYDYMNFVANLEAKVVNRGTQLVSFDGLGLGVGAGVRLDAWKIYCDEAHHAHSSFDMIRQVEVETAVAQLPYHFDHVLRRLDAVGRHLTEETPGLAHLLQVVVFETVVTALLEDIPRDPGVVTAVRAVVGDHARDERLHHAFYTRFFHLLWGVLDPTARRRAALCLPEIVVACLSPDLPAVRGSLRAAGLPADDVEQVIGESYPDEVVLADVRCAARHTLRMFADHDVFDLPGAYDAFAGAGLLPVRGAARPAAVPQRSRP